MSPDARHESDVIGGVNREVVFFTMAFPIRDLPPDVLDKLEVAVSARGPEHWPTLRSQLLDPLLPVDATPCSEVIATEIMDSLLGAGLHRAVLLPDVLVASLAATNRMTVLHHDPDFDRIQDLYGAPTAEWLTL